MVFTEISKLRTGTTNAPTTPATLYLAHRNTVAKKAKRARE